jgi:hypothetical protein
MSVPFRIAHYAYVRQMLVFVKICNVHVNHLDATFPKRGGYIELFVYI